MVILHDICLVDLCCTFSSSSCPSSNKVTRLERNIQDMGELYVLYRNGKDCGVIHLQVLFNKTQGLGLRQICQHNLKHSRLTCYAGIIPAFWGSILE